MNYASQWRYDLVQGIVPLYAANPHVAAVLVGGSTARGQADRYSDIELGVFWQQPPTETERQEAAAGLSPMSDLLYLYPYDPVEEVWCDDFMLGRAQFNQPKSGILLEVVHYTVDFIERTFVEVLEKHNPDPLKQNLIAGILDGIPQYNHELIERWQQRGRAYPYELALTVVQRHAQIDHFWRWQMWVARQNNLMMLYQSFAQVQNKLLHTLLGVNRTYYFGFKWLDVVNERLAYKPDKLVTRLAQVYEREPAVGAQLLAELVEETYELVEHHLPEIDVEWLRAVFRYQRPIWDDKPPYH